MLDFIPDSPLSDECDPEVLHLWSALVDGEMPA